MIKPKAPTIKFARTSLMAFCIYSFVTFEAVSSIALIMKTKRTAWARKMASFSAPSQIYLVIKLRVYRRLPLDCLGFKLNLSPIIKRFMSSAPKMKLLTQKTKIGDFKFKIGIFCASSSSLFSSSVPSLFSSIFSRAKSFGSLSCNNEMIEFAFIFSPF